MGQMRVGAEGVVMGHIVGVRVQIDSFRSMYWVRRRALLVTWRCRLKHALVLQTLLSLIYRTRRVVSPRPFHESEGTTKGLKPTLVQVDLRAWGWLSLLEEWRGLRDEALSSTSGIPGCIFVHAGGFIGGNQTRDGALEMARRTLQTAPTATSV
ncbi:hypothetical protein DNTS_018569 [Danionella cerebrum]|uniref:Uncharacterized protein n=1 Tax=Danionella cerebrum TaxID=2873325 RepID=A0A553Q9F3_9TELE|nr:hypothetical protein DNTS_018569 [Danionella translucida]